MASRPHSELGQRVLADSNTPSVFLSDPDVTLWHGNVVDVLRQLPVESVDCVVTSPPYWGLRDYGTAPQVFGGTPDCEHEWGEHRRRLNNRHAHAMREGLDTGDGIGGLGKDKNDGNPVDWNVKTSYCQKCGAWLGSLGLEPTPEQYVERMVEVFREVRRVLAAHGTCWLNLGDSYNAGRSGGWAGGKGSLNEGRDLDAIYQNRSGANVAELKPKDLVGIPWKVAFALQADGWYLRSDIIWSKPNPMPESVTDRPTKAHEYVFLLSKQPRYFFDAEAVREEYAPKTLTHRGGGKAAGKVGQQDGLGKVASGNFGDWDKPRTAHPRPRPQEETLDGSDGEAPRGPDGRRNTHVQAADGSIQHRDGERWPNGGRNIRSVWEIATQPYPEAHFATFPEELARRAIAAGTSEVGKCPECGTPWVRVVERQAMEIRRSEVSPYDHHSTRASGKMMRPAESVTRGWRHACAVTCSRTRAVSNSPVPSVVLDPFIGSGTVAFVARKLNRHSIGIDLNAEYLELAARRLQQQSLFAQEAVSGT